MTNPVLRWLSAGVLSLTGVSAAAAQQPAPLPPPREVVVVPGPLPMTGAYRQSAYDVWQKYAVGQRGQWKLRVINAPEGAYYLYNGAPYPWVPSYPQYFQSTIVGQ